MRHPASFSKAAGFTLVEILVVTGLVGILMVIGVAIYLANNRFYETESGEIFSVANTRDAADKISEYGRLAAGLVSSHVYASVTYNTGATAAVFRVPSINSSGQIITGTYDYVVIGRDPENSSRLILILDADPGSSRTERTLQLTDKLAALSFTYDDADPSFAKNMNFEIRVTQTGRYPATEQIYGGVTFRNK